MSNRRPSKVLTDILAGMDEATLRHTRDRMRIAGRIADALNEKGLTQKEFAAMMGRSESEISDWLSGDRNFTLDTLSDICEKLSINLLEGSRIDMKIVPHGDLRLRFKKSATIRLYGLHEIDNPAYVYGGCAAPVSLHPLYDIHFL